MCLTHADVQLNWTWTRVKLVNSSNARTETLCSVVQESDVTLIVVWWITHDPPSVAPFYEHQLRCSVCLCIRVRNVHVCTAAVWERQLFLPIGWGAAQGHTVTIAIGNSLMQEGRSSALYNSPSCVIPLLLSGTPPHRRKQLLFWLKLFLFFPGRGTIEAGGKQWFYLWSVHFCRFSFVLFPWNCVLVWIIFNICVWYHLQ